MIHSVCLLVPVRWLEGDFTVGVLSYCVWRGEDQKEVLWEGGWQEDAAVMEGGSAQLDSPLIWTPGFEQRDKSNSVKL